MPITKFNNGRLNTGTSAGQIVALDGSARLPAVDGSLLTNLSLNPNGNIVAWCLFNGTGTPAIIAQKNVSSITDYGTGQFGCNFTVPLSSANYVAFVSCSGVSNGSVIGMFGNADHGTDLSVNYVRFNIRGGDGSAGAAADAVRICVAVIQ